MGVPRVAEGGIAMAKVNDVETNKRFDRQLSHDHFGLLTLSFIQASNQS
jgi:hypothetical protein